MGSGILSVMLSFTQVRVGNTPHDQRYVGYIQVIEQYMHPEGNHHGKCDAAIRAVVLQNRPNNRHCHPAEEQEEAD